MHRATLFAIEREIEALKATNEHIDHYLNDDETNNDKGFLHNDLHLGNFMVKKTAQNEITTKLIDNDTPTLSQ